MDRSIIIGLDSGDIFIVRDGVELHKIASSLQILKAVVLEPNSYSNPCLLVIAKNDSLHLVPLSGGVPIELPISNMITIAARYNLMGLSTRDGLFSIYSILSMGNGPIVMIPLPSPSTIIAFHFSAKVFALAFPDRVQIYKGAIHNADTT